MKAQREALNELSRQAAVFLSRDGHAPSADVLRRVTLDLQGLAAQGGAADGPAPGRLTSDVEATGFDALAALVPKSGDGPSRGATGTSKVLSFAPTRQPAVAKSAGGGNDEARRERERAQAAAARRAVQDAERTLAAARRDATKAEAAMKAAAARLKELEREKQKAEAAMEKAAAAADTARQAARRTPVKPPTPRRPWTTPSEPSSAPSPSETRAVLGGGVLASELELGLPDKTDNRLMR